MRILDEARQRLAAMLVNMRARDIVDSGDDGALALPARQLVRVLLRLVRAQAHGAEQLGHTLGALPHGADGMDVERFPDRLARGRAQGWGASRA